MEMSASILERGKTNRRESRSPTEGKIREEKEKSKKTSGKGFNRRPGRKKSSRGEFVTAYVPNKRHTSKETWDTWTNWSDNTRDAGGNLPTRSARICPFEEEA